MKSFNETIPSETQQQRNFERLIAGCRRNAYAVAYHLLGDAAEAEDVTQEGCVRAWLHFDAYDPSRPFEAWLLRIVRNLAIDAHRRRKRRRTLSLEATGRKEEDGPWMLVSNPARNSDPQHRVLAAAEGEQLAQALTQLSPRHREVLWLLQREQDSYESIAQLLDCPVGTVRSRVFRARKAAREALAQMSPAF